MKRPPVQQNRCLCEATGADVQEVAATWQQVMSRLFGTVNGQ